MTNSQGIAEDSKPMSRYSMVVVAAKRAKQIKEGAPILIDTDSTNPLTIAMEEIAQGKVTVNDSAVTQAPAPKTPAAPASPARAPRLKEPPPEPLQILSPETDQEETEEMSDSASLDGDDDQEAEAMTAETDDDTSDEDAA